jgi:hypothetical protein
MGKGNSDDEDPVSWGDLSTKRSSKSAGNCFGSGTLHTAATQNAHPSEQLI